jgi:hypothetical protein
MTFDLDHFPAGIFAILVVLLSVGSATGQEKAPGVVVTQETYCRAETDRTFNNTRKLAGGVNRFFHFRSVTPLDNQTVVRMNRDTLYSAAIVDTSKRAMITVPKMPAGRYCSVLLIDNDHYCPGVIYDAGTHQLPEDTKYLGVLVRIQLLKPTDPEDVALVNKLQDQFVIEAGSADPFPVPKWDAASLEKLTAAYKAKFDKYEKYPDGFMAARGKADEKLRHLACAGAWGLFPNEHAVYINYNGRLPAAGHHTATYNVPENNAFWSITIYGADGYMKSENSILNKFNTKINPDGTFTVHFGSKEDCGDVPNRLDVVDGWNFLMRVYRPGKSVLDGSYQLPDVTLAKALTPAEARAIAKDAYIYGFPLVDNMRVQYTYFTDKKDPDYKAPYNTLFNIPRVFTPDDKAIQTANSDTPYSWIGLDLRAEPIVFTVPAIARERYWSLQLIDLYTHNFDYLGSRTTGNDGGSFLIAGPKWRGEKPKGITKVIRCETEIASAQFRTQLFNPADLDNVKQIQAQYIVKPLSAFLGQPASKAAPWIDFPQPLTPATQRTSLEFFTLLNFYLQFCPTHPSEEVLMDRFAKIGVGAGRPFDASKLSPETKQAIEGGIADAWAEFQDWVGRVNKGEVSSGDVFGTREYLKNNYLYRMGAAVLGIYGNTKEEAIYPVYYVDGDKQKLDGSNRYTLRFAKGQLPPVHSFWSLTMYDQPESLLVHNPINRYLLNSTMLSEFKIDDDGGLTLYIQHESPGKDKEANWLPAPTGPFSVIMRLYWPKAEALDGTWTAPPLQKTK